MNEEVSRSILSLGGQLIGRLGEDYVYVALDYVGHGENLLALDTLAGYLEEFDAPLKEGEHAEFLRLAAQFNADGLPPFIRLRIA
jgi:hypothetical protein